MGYCRQLPGEQHGNQNLWMRELENKATQDFEIDTSVWVLGGRGDSTGGLLFWFEVASIN